MTLSKKAFLLSISFIHAFYFAGSLALKSYMNNDSGEYINQAKNLIDHASLYAGAWDVWPHLPEYYTMRPPLYGIMVLITMIATTNPYVLLFTQSILSFITCLLIRKSALKYIQGIKENTLHWFLILAFVLNPVQLILCNSIFSDILFQLLVTLGFFALLKFTHSKNLKHFLFYILFFSLALLTKPVLVYFAFFNLLLTLYCYIKIKPNWVLFPMAMILPLIVVMVSSLNENKTGYYHYSSSKVFNLWAYNTTNFLNMKYGNDSGFVYKSAIYTLSLGQPDFKHQYGFIDSACSHVLKQNLKSYIPFHVQGMFIFFMAPGREFMNDYLARTDAVPKSFMKEINVNGWQGLKNYLASQHLILLIVNILVTCWNFLLFVGLIVFTFSKRIPFSIKLIALFLIFYVAGVSSLALGTARYKAAIYPLLLFCNAWIWGGLKFKS